MSEHRARIRWSRQAEEAFIDLRYSRAHTWEFDGGVIVPASSAPSSVPLPYSKAENVDPEEAFVAAISSCHMLTFLYLAARERLVVDAYEDCAIGRMGRNDKGRLAVSLVRLQPRVVLSGARPPGDADVGRLHHAAHEECYIANSVSCRIETGGAWEWRSPPT